MIVLFCRGISGGKVFSGGEVSGIGDQNQWSDPTNFESGKLQRYQVSFDFRVQFSFYPPEIHALNEVSTSPLQG